jgi:hypothetical protein
MAHALPLLPLGPQPTVAQDGGKARPALPVLMGDQRQRDGQGAAIGMLPSSISGAPLSIAARA